MYTSVFDVETSSKNSQGQIKGSLKRNFAFRVKTAKRQCPPTCAGDEASLDRRGVDASFKPNLSILAYGPFGLIFDQNDGCIERT